MDSDDQVQRNYDFLLHWNDRIDYCYTKKSDG